MLVSWEAHMGREDSRRNFLKYVPVALVSLCVARSVAAQPQNGQNGAGQNGRPEGMGSGGGGIPTPKIVPPGTDTNTTLDSSDGKPGAPSLLHGDKYEAPNPVIRRDPEQERIDMRIQVTKLASAAEELKKEVLKTDTTSVLSLDMIKHAQNIEKLARQIAQLAKA
jgi:hypothetical protein